MYPHRVQRTASSQRLDTWPLSHEIATRVCNDRQQKKQQQKKENRPWTETCGSSRCGHRVNTRQNSVTPLRLSPFISRLPSRRVPSFSTFCRHESRPAVAGGGAFSTNQQTQSRVNSHCRAQKHSLSVALKTSEQYRVLSGRHRLVTVATRSRVTVCLCAFLSLCLSVSLSVVLSVVLLSLCVSLSVCVASSPIAVGSSDSKSVGAHVSL